MGDDFLSATEALTYGDVTDLTNFGGALIDERAFAKNVTAIERAKSAANVTVAVGGEYDDSEGYFVKPTVLLSDDPSDESFSTEYFGPILSVHVYPDGDYERVIDVVDDGARYALTGAVIADDRAAVLTAQRRLRHAAGNFYVNDKPTGAVVGQQPFGGSRASGTNDKAGSPLNLLRWTSARSIKETFVPRRTTPIPTWRRDVGVFERVARPAIMAVSRSDGLRRTAERLPVTRQVVHRFVPGETVAHALDSVAQLRNSERLVSIDYLGEDVTDVDAANATVDAYLALLDALDRRDEPAAAVRPLEVSLKLSALGQALPRDGEKIAPENAHTICERAQRAGAWVTVDAEDHSTTDSTLSIVRDLRAEFGWLGTVLQAYLRRTETDCRSSPPLARAFGCARARTTSPHRWRTAMVTTSPRLISHACEC